MNKIIFILILCLLILPFNTLAVGIGNGGNYTQKPGGSTFSISNTGVPVFGVRNDSAATLANTNLGYGPVAIDSTGKVLVSGTLNSVESAVAHEGDLTNGSSLFKLMAGKDPTNNVKALTLDAAGLLKVSATVSELATAATGATSNGSSAFKMVAGIDSGLVVRPLLTDNTGQLQVVTTSAALPTGAASQGQQLSGNTSLLSISTSVVSLVGKFGSLGQKTMAGSAPVVIASDQSAIPASQSGNWSTRTQDGAGNTIGSTASALDVNVKSTTGNLMVTQSSVFAISALQGALPAGANSIGTVKAQLQDNAGSAVVLGLGASTASLPVVLASDQPRILTKQAGRYVTTTARYDYSSTSVGTTSWVQLIATMPNSATYLDLFDSSGQSLELGLGGAGSEQRLVLIPPGGNGPVPVVIPSGARVSIRAVSTFATVGELITNMYQ